MPVPTSFCYSTKCEDDIHSKLECYHGPDSQKNFVEYFKSEINWIYNVMQINKPISMSSERKNTYYKVKICYMCNTLFTDDNYKVRDHNHLIRESLGMMFIYL